MLRAATEEDAAAVYAQFVESMRALDGSAPIEARVSVDRPNRDCGSTTGPTSC